MLNDIQKVVPTITGDCTSAVENIFHLLEDKKAKIGQEEKIVALKENDEKIKQLNFMDICNNYKNDTGNNMGNEPMPNGYKKS